MNISNQSSQDSLSKQRWLLQGTNKNKKHLHETSLKRRETTEEKSCQSRLVFSLESDWLRSDSNFLTQSQGSVTQTKTILDNLRHATQNTSYLEKPWLVTRSSCNKRSSWIRLGSWSHCVGGKMLGINRAKSIGLRSENSAKRIMLYLCMKSIGDGEIKWVIYEPGLSE